MRKWIYDKYLGNEWNIIFEINKGKKIICFGAGSATYYVPEILPKGIKIDYFLDNNKTLWGISLNNSIVKNPNSIKKEKKGTFIILIVSQHAMSIKHQLIEFGLKENIDFYDIYTTFEKFFRMQKVAFQADRLLNFINTIPLKSLNCPTIKNKKIGVVAACGHMGMPMFHDIALFLLLNYNGYSAELIMDNTYTCENFTMYEGASQDIKCITDEIISYLKNKFDHLIIRFIDETKKANLTIEDLNTVQKNSIINTIWQKSRQNKRSIEITEEELQQKFYNVFLNNLSNVKAFFEENKYDIITISTALHYHRGLYMWVAKLKNIRVANYDGANNDGRISWATDWPNGHHYDIPKLILENYFTEEEKQQIIKNAIIHFNKRRYAVSNGEAYNYQLVKKGQGEQINNWYDIIIPLNVMWDAAAIGLNHVFSTEIEWLIETITYILEYTNANIMIREHPVQVQLEKYNNGCYEELLKKHFGENSRLKVIKYNFKLNTYEYIEHCKVVLPLSSTIGLESIFIGKPVITHSNCYYSKLNFVKAAQTKEEYFQYIKDALDETIIISSADMEEAYLAYYLLMNSRIYSCFSEAKCEWLFKSIDELNKDSSVKAILNVITNDIPIPYYNTINNLKNLKQSFQVLHLASFNGNIGDHANHKGFQRCFKEYISSNIEITELEIREFYYSWNLRKFDIECINYINTFDLLIIGGGNFFDIRWNESLNGTTINLSIENLKKIKIPILINGIGIDDNYGNATQTNLKKFEVFLDEIVHLKNCYFTVRNDGSKEIAQKYYKEATVQKIYTIPDGGFFFKPMQFIHPEIPKNKTIIALNIAGDLPEIRYENKANNNTITKQEFNIEIANVLNKLLETNDNIHIIFIPHIAKDYIAFTELIPNIKDSFIRTKFSVSPYVTGSITNGDYIFDLYRNCHLTIGMRYHSNIGSIAVNTPTIGIVNLEKHRNLYKSIGMQERLISYNQPKFGQRLYEKILWSLNNLEKLKNENIKLLDNLNNEYIKYFKEIKKFLEIFY